MSYNVILGIESIMNIVYIVPEISHPGGIGRVTSIKANYLAKKGNDVTIITEIQGKASPYYDLNDNIRHYDIGLKVNDNKLLKYFRRKKRLKKILEEIRPNIIVYTYFMYPIRCNFEYKSILECHFNHDVAILKARAFNLSMFKAKLLTKYNEYVSSRFNVLVVLTHQDKSMWEKSCKKSNIIVIPNMNSFIIDQKSCLVNKRIIAVGRLDAQKGFDRLISIWAKVYCSHKDWQLNIYGKGPDKEKLEAQIMENGLSNSVFIKNPVKDIKNKYLESSIFCFTSTYEGWGLVLTEAMSCGVPVVSYDIPCGPKDIIKNNYNGLLVKDGNDEEFVKSLLLLMDNQTIRNTMGLNAQKSVRKYEIDVIMNKWSCLFSQLKRNDTV